jgi:hypothetical protein
MNDILTSCVLAINTLLFGYFEGSWFQRGQKLDTVLFLGRTLPEKPVLVPFGSFSERLKKMNDFCLGHVYKMKCVDEEDIEFLPAIKCSFNRL